MGKDQFWAVEYEEFLAIMETAAEFVEQRIKNMYDTLAFVKNELEKQSFCVRPAKDVNEPNLVCIIDADYAEVVANNILQYLDSHRRWDGDSTYTKKFVRSEIEPEFAIKEEEKDDEEVAS